MSSLHARRSHSGPRHHGAVDHCDNPLTSQGLPCTCYIDCTDRHESGLQGEGYMGPSFRPIPQDAAESPLIQSIPEGAPPSYGLGRSGGGGDGGSAGSGARLPRLEPPVRTHPQWRCTMMLERGRWQVSGADGMSRPPEVDEQRYCVAAS